MINGKVENKTLWGEAVRVAAYLYNSSPTKLNAKTAYEMWNGEKHNLNYLRIFGIHKRFKTVKKIKQQA